MGEKEISEFISHLAVQRSVASSTQNQALNAIVFLYRQVLRIELGDFGPMERAKKPKRLPVVMSQDESRRVLLHMSGEHQLMAKLLYGCGLLLMECVRLRVKDEDSARGRLRHPHRAGAARPPERANNHDLHPRDQEGRNGGQASAGHAWLSAAMD
jgi:site-specific recombinase XerD